MEEVEAVAHRGSRIQITYERRHRQADDGQRDRPIETEAASAGQALHQHDDQWEQQVELKQDADVPRVHQGLVVVDDVPVVSSRDGRQDVVGEEVGSHDRAAQILVVVG